MNKKLLIIFSVALVVILSVLACIYYTRLDITVPKVTIKFVSPNEDGKKYTLDYSYCYVGSNFFTIGTSDAYSCSPTLSTSTGTEITIPETKILSYLPNSKFHYLLINADDNKELKCNWIASIWSDEQEGLLSKAQPLKESINEFLLRNTKNRVIEIKCLSDGAQLNIIEN